MKCEIKTITPVRPSDVGDLRFEFRVELVFDDQQHDVDVTAAELTDFRQFQQIVLAKTGILPDVGLTEADGEFDAYRRWQNMLQAATWMREHVPSFDTSSLDDSDDDSSEPFYGFKEEN